MKKGYCVVKLKEGWKDKLGHTPYLIMKESLFHNHPNQDLKFIKRFDSVTEATEFSNVMNEANKVL